MRILIVGGTRFVGRAIAAAALERGHDLTLLHRHQTDLFPQAEHLLTDRDEDLGILTDRTFDASVDVCAYWPRQARALSRALDGRGGHHLQISSVSAYGDVAAHGLDESAPLATTDADDPDALPMTDQTYGPLKALCELAAAEGHERLTVVRPTYVVGPHDPTGRFTYWVDRLAQGGRVVFPGPATAAMQVIDARDQGEWIVRLLEEGVLGAYHSCSPEPPWSFADMLTEVAEAIDRDDLDPVWVEPDVLRAAGIDENRMPLWSGGVDEGASAMDPAAAYKTGLRPRPFGDTVRDTLEWIRTADWRRPGVGIDAETETRLLNDRG